MVEIVLATLNARYLHASFGLRYLMANLGELQSRAKLLEFDINQRPTDILESILEASPKIVGLGVYIWNVTPTTHLVAELKRVRPDITVIIGGPEVSYETDGQEIVALADYTITGEADLAFAELCRQLLVERRHPLQKIIPASLPEFAPRAGVAASPHPSSFIPHPSAPAPAPLHPSPFLSLPYSLYTDEDIANRIIYVEASRGCPFKCEFCLSSLDVPVRTVPLEKLLAELGTLLERGVRHFKFVDRTFNLNIATSSAILEFFLARHRPGLFLHFEMIPNRLPTPLRSIIAQFPPGALQFEVGVQTFNEAVAERISRKQNNAKMEENIRFVREQTGVHLHVDLIAGLPGEDLASFGDGFDRLIGLNPQEIQVGILKRLRGTPIVRHNESFKMVYSPNAPYEILQNSVIDFATMQRLRRFSRYWDLLGNSGNFIRTLPMVWGGHVGSAPRTNPVGSAPRTNPARSAPRTNFVDAAPDGPRGGPYEDSPFWALWALCDWLFESTGRRTHAIALPRLVELLFTYLTTELGVDAGEAALALVEDYTRPARREVPAFLREHLPADYALPSRAQRTSPLPRRQSRHLRQSTQSHPTPAEADE